jgi:hypothetical protein
MAKASKTVNTSTAAELKSVEILNKYIEDQIRGSKELQSSIDDIADSYTDLANVLQGIVKNAKLFGEEWGDIEDISKSLLRNLENIGSEYYEQVDTQKQLQQIAEKRKSLDADKVEAESQINAFRRKGMSIEAEKAEQSLAETIQSQENLNLAEKHVIALESQLNVLNQAHKVAKEMGIDIKQISKEITSPFEKIMSFLDSVPGGGILSKFLGVDGKMEELSKKVLGTFVTKLGETGSVGKASLGALSTGASAFMTSLGPLLPILAAVAAALYALKKAFDLDQEVTNLAKGLAISKNEAIELNNQFIAIAANTKVVGANTKALAESYTELANSLGVSQLASAELAETQVYLKNQIGLAAEEAADFQKFSMASGKTAEQNLAVIKTAVDSLSGGLLNYKEVAKDIAKSSKAVQASYKGNITALAKAAVQAKKLGMTLDETKAIADSFLDIETSVGAEMEANVLTGKHMNMEHARELALQGKTAEAAAEAVKQAGTYDELMSMAPYQQAAIAKAAGTTVDKLIEAAEAQKNLNSIANSLGITLRDNEKLTDEQIAQAASLGNEEAKKLAIANQQAAAQEKLAMLGDKLMLIFSKLATPLMEMLDPLMEMIDTIFPALQVAIEIAFFPLKAAAQLLSGIVKAFSGTPSSQKSPSTIPMNDGIIESDGLSVMSPKGTYSLNENDSIVAGTNISSNSGNSTKSSNNNSRIETLLEKLIAKVDQPVQIVMGGRVIDQLDTRTTLRKTYNTSVDQGYGVFG